MMSRFQWLVHNLFQKLWVIAGAFALLGLSTAFIAELIGPLLPDGLVEKFGSESVAPILTILATTMLTVVTFSVSVMVSALANAASHVTPRVTALLSSDRTTQHVLSIFLGAFIFSLIGLIGLQGGLYTKNERLVLFAVTALVVAIVVIAMLRWIQHLTVFGLMSDSIEKVETSARRAIASRMRDPAMGARLRTTALPQDARPVPSDRIGYVRHVDLETLQDWAEKDGAHLHVTAMPGAFVHPGRALVSVSGGAGGDRSDILGAFTIEDTRSFDQDPRFGLCVLAEVAQRALSPAVNDPGTAIDIMTRAVRLLSLWSGMEEREVRFPRIDVPPVEAAALLADIFPPIARDGAALYSVQMRLQKSLAALAAIHPATFGAAALHESRQAMLRAEGGDLLPDELDTLRKLAARLEAGT